MKRLSLLLIAFFPVFLFAQHFEAGLMAGVSNYQGDLAPANPINTIRETHASYGGFIRYNMVRSHHRGDR